MASTGRRRAVARPAAGRRRAEVRRSRAPLALGAVALLAIGVTVAATTTVGPLAPAADEPAATPTPGASASPSARGDAAAQAEPTHAAQPTPSGLAPIDVDLSNLPVPRRLDCAVLDEGAVEEALGAPVSLRRGYVTGDRVEVTPGVVDVVAEDGCLFRSPRATARVWVFAAPVGTAYARTLVQEARREPGCTPRPDETGFGDPTLTDVCADDEASSTATLRGLFGDAWLTCRLSVQDAPQAAVLDRAQRWCVEVAVTLGARP